MGIFSTWIGEVFAVSNIDNFTAPRDEKIWNDLLDSIRDRPSTWPSRDKLVTIEWAEGIQGFILKIARDFKNLVFALSTAVFLVLVYRLLFASNTEEEATKFRKWIIWTILWIVVMQLAFSTVNILFDRPVDETLGQSLLDGLFIPFVNLLLFGASFAFLAVWIAAFYMIITAGGDEEKAKKWKLAVAYAIVWFIVIRFAQALVNASYSATFSNGEGGAPEGIIQIIADIINWISPFIALIVVIMIIYAGAQLLFSNGDEDKLKKVKRTILYIVFGLLILAFNYIIVTFFLTSDVTTIVN